MLFAKHPSTAAKIPASPRAWAICPGCAGTVLTKCGEINAWHWAHEAGVDCDPWSEGETFWHLSWKWKAPPDRCEVVIGRHRADIVGRKGVVVELQHGPLSPAEVREREAFYRDMIWIVDGGGFRDNFNLRRKSDDVFTFRWKYPRKWTFAITQALCFDFGDDGLFLVRKLYGELPCGGYGSFLDTNEFLRRWVI
jgi:hypothetical protein